jgi:hypothetical protein
MTKPLLFLHIGYAKTGTSSLQRTFFDKHNEIEFVGNLSPEKEQEWKEFDGVVQITPNTNGSVFFDDIVNTESIFFNEVLEKYKNIFSEYIKPNKVLVYSLEDFVTNHRNNFDIGLISNRLHQIFNQRFEVKILISIREQKSILPSYFGTLYSGSYYNFLEEMLKTPNQRVLASFFYYEVSDYYIKLFGRENVHILLFEEFIADRQNYILKLSKILNVRLDYSLLQDKDKLNIAPKKSNGDYIVSLQVIASSIRQKTFLKYIPMNNLFFRKIALVLTKVRVPYKTLNMTNEQIAAINKIYCKSNKKLMKRFNLDLKKYGYSLDE